MSGAIQADLSFLNIMDRGQWGYCLFDAGYWAYASVTMLTVAPILFIDKFNDSYTQLDEALQEDDVSRRAHPSSYWALMVALSTLLAGILCPIIGFLVDAYSVRKATTYGFAIGMILAMTVYAYLPSDVPWAAQLSVVGVAMLASSLMHCYFNSLLMTVSPKNEDVTKISALQSCFGAWGSAILMTCLGMQNEEVELSPSYVFLAFLAASLYFIVFALPMWFWVEEAENESPSSLEATAGEAWRETLKTLSRVPMMQFLGGVLLYNDAMSTINAVYLVYAGAQGVPVHHLLVGAVFQRWLLGAASLLWLFVSTYSHPLYCFLAAIAACVVSSFLGAFMHSTIEFYIFIVVFTFASQGGYIFSRVLMVGFTPTERASHNFGFMGLINRMAGFLGPMLYSALSLLFSPMWGFMALGVLAIFSFVVVWTVDYEKGAQEKQMLSAANKEGGV